MRVETIQRELYTFEELDEKAKEKARDWYRTCLYGDTFEFDCTVDDCKEIAKAMGIDIKNVYYSVSYSQGDGACFEGTYNYKKGSVNEVKKDFPNETKIHEIAAAFQELQKRNFYKLTATVKQSGHYYNSSYASFDILKEGDYVPDETEKELKNILKSFMNYIYKRLVQTDEYQNSNESIDENIIANDYEFLKDGKRA